MEEFLINSVDDQNNGKEIYERFPGGFYCFSIFLCVTGVILLVRSVFVVDYYFLFFPSRGFYDHYIVASEGLL